MRNSRRGEVDPFIVMDVMEAARAAEAAGRHIIHMEVGQPGQGAPSGAVARLSADMAADPLGYTVGLGLPELRARIARHYLDWYGVELDPERVVITAGASGAFLLAFSALFDTGARVGLGAPCYPSYRQILKALDMAPVDMPTTLEARMQPVAAGVADHDLDGLIVASPANPTGTMLGRDELAALASACAAANAPFISDEIYHGLAYADRAVSALEVTDEVYVINSFSKYFSMTGWRVGWMVVHGAFYVYVDVSAYTDDSLAFCTQVLDKAGVAITPGLDFDPVKGHHWVRLSYARSTDDIREGLARLATFMDTQRAAS